MTDTFRELCEELTEKLQEHTCLYEGHESELVARAHALLAQPEPVAPTEEDLEDLAEVMNVSGNPVPAMRRALELWGRQ
jgi:hypothetical protein